MKLIYFKRIYSINYLKRYQVYSIYYDDYSLNENDYEI